LLLFDSLFLLVATGYVIVSFTKCRKLSVWFLIATSICFAMHIWIETYRWQMIPAYMITLVAWLRILGRRTESSKLGLTLNLILVVTSLGLSYVLPVFEIPAPEGPYGVGTTTRHLIDITRPETATINPEDKREIGLKIWYPSATSDYPKANYWSNSHERNRAMLAGFKAPETFGFLFSHIAGIVTNSHVNAPVASGPFPILIFSHALNFGTSEQNTILMEHLASYGYLVVSITHTYGGLFYRFPDGRMSRSEKIQKKSRRIFELEQTDELDNLSIHSTDSLEDLTNLLLRAGEILKQTTAFHQDNIDTWSKDQIFVIDKLFEFEKDDPLLAGKLNTDLIGVFGMSFGGTTSLQTCVLDTRCKAVANIDGFQINSIYLPPLQVPLLIISEMKYQWNRVTFASAISRSYLVSVSETEHANFTDLALLSPLLIGTSVLGTIEPGRGLELINTIVKTFFDTELQNLEGKHVSDLDISEVIITHNDGVKSRNRKTRTQIRDQLIHFENGAISL